MSFPRHPEIYPPMEAQTNAVGAPAHRLDEFPAGYSLAGCAPAEPASASPAGNQYALQSSCRSRIFQRTANSVLTVCVSRGGKRNYVLCRDLEPGYLAACPQPLKDAAQLILETGLRVEEALSLTWNDVALEPTAGKKFGYIQIRKAKRKKNGRAISLTPRAVEMLAQRKCEAVNHLVFPGDLLTKPFQPGSLAHQHQRVRDKLKLPDGFVLHSLRHTALTRLGEAGADVFTIMKIAGHNSITMSQRYVHPSDDAMELAFEKLGLVGAQAVKGTSALAANA